MEKSNGTKQAARICQRRKTTLTVTILATIVSVFSFILMRLRVAHMHIIIIMVVGVSILLVTYLIIWTLSAYEQHAKLAKILKICYTVCLAVGLTFFIILQSMIISGSKTDNAEADVLIVLGAGLRNGAPSLVLAYRLNAAAEYVRTRENIPIIVTGGIGRGETISEGEAMARYLIARGVDENLIWKEETSTRTFENIRNAVEIMEEKGMDVENITVAVVSNEFHLYRAKLIAEKAGLEAMGIAAETPGLHRRILYYFREAFSLTRELLS